MSNLMDILESYTLGGSQAPLFEKKLREQTGWDRKFGKRAVEEYKRFMYLISISPSPLSPSTVVDEVWHLHLTYSRCYWDQMCGKILKQKVHHDPAMPAEQHMMNRQYLNTLELYKKCFGEAPPRDYWPVSVPETRGTAVPRVAMLFATASSALFGLSVMASDLHSDDSSDLWFWVIFGIVGLLLVRYLYKGNRPSGKGGSGGGAGCGGYGSGGNDSGSNDGGSGCGGGGCGG